MYFKIIALSLLIIILAVSIGFYQDYEETNERAKLKAWSQHNQINISDLKLEKFEIEYNQTEWQLLKDKLEKSRYFDKLDKESTQNFEYGFDRDYAEELVNYWKDSYDWKQTVNKLNRFPQFKVSFNNVCIHFVRYITNENKKDLKRVPLLLIDGWPGSFSSFYKMIDYLNEDAQYSEYSFDIVVPSIPGYGFSTPLNKPLDIIHAAQYFDSIMRLLHGESTEYFIHGEDWGSAIAASLAQLYPHRVMGIHLSMPVIHNFSNIYTFLNLLMSSVFPSFVLSPQEMEKNYYMRNSLTNYIKTIWLEGGYLHLQSTKPDTLGHALTDSPVGLMAYILEKYSSWSFDLPSQILGSQRGGLDNFDKDELLTIVSIYWFTNSITSLFYKATLSNKNYPQNVTRSMKTVVPTALQYSSNEILVFPSNVLKNQYTNIKQFNIMENAGHFAAFHNPELVAKDLVEFIQKIL